MMTKFVVVAFFALVAVCTAGVIPAGVIAPYATSYNAHTVNHAIATPVVSAPYVAPAVVSSPYVAAAAPAVVSSPYLAAPAAYSAYSALPAFF